MKRQRVWVVLLTGGSLLLAALILTDWLPVLRGPAPETPEWYWPYQLRPFSRWLLPALALLLLWLVCAWWLRLERHGRAQVAGLWLVAAASLLAQLALIQADNPHLRDELINRTYSNLASGFFQPAAELEGINQALAGYPALMPAFASEHARTHPPGLLVANRLTMDLLARFPALAERLAPPAIAARCIDLWLLDRPPAVAAALLVWALIPLVAAALTVFPAYGLARLLLPATAVKLGTLLAATLPALLLFAPKSVQLYAPLSLLIAWAFGRGLRQGKPGWFLLAGWLLSLATFLSLGNAALGLLLLVYALLDLWQKSRSGQPHPWTASRLWLAALAFGLGAALLWLVYWAGWGVPPWAIAQTGLGQHYALVTNLRRYEWWLVWNLVDVAIFAGWVVVVGVTAVFVSGWRRRPWTPAQMLALSLAVMLLLLNLSGSARGEGGRLWLFLMPLMALAAAAFLARLRPGWRWQALWLGWQLLLALCLALAWRPVRAVAVVAERPPMPQAIPQVETTASFAGIIQLDGYTVEEVEGQLMVTLFWRETGAVLRPYTVFTQLLDEEGVVVAQQDNWPVNGQWPPTCWKAGETVVDRYTLVLPPDLPSGGYTLITGWYDARDGRRLLLPDGQSYLPLRQWVRARP